MKTLLQDIGMAAVDAWMAAIPRKRPPRSAIDNCKIVSHRGSHDNRTVLENTMPAFEAAVAAGAWGIEADIRWTADLLPVIHHDPDTRRLFGKAFDIRRTDFKELREALPAIPTLEELIRQFGGKTHLMLELKEEPFPQIELQKDILRAQLAQLRPAQDYHFLALDPLLFETFDIQPRHCCLPVARAEVSPMSEAAVRSGYGGLTGHYLLLDDRVRQRHRMAGQDIGTGFIRSRNCLFREINRGVEWVFTNDAEKLRKIIDEIGIAPDS